MYVMKVVKNEIIEGKLQDHFNQFEAHKRSWGFGRFYNGWQWQNSLSATSNAGTFQKSHYVYNE